MNSNGNITDAEWQVMRIIWSEGETTSARIISELEVSRKWSPTTVKTLLARLVKKSIISYITEGRTRRYSACISELDCVKNEMNTVIKRLYGGAENKRTEHFIFYGGNDTEYIELLSHELENNYHRIMESVGCEDHGEIMVYTHETQERLHSALGVNNGPKWLRGGWAWGVLHIAPATCFDDIKAEKVAVHVFAQISIDRVNRNTPYWLMQGCSAYLAKWLEGDRVRNSVRKNFTELSEAMLNEIGSDYERFKDNMGYELAYTVAEFIAETFGYGHLARFIRKPADYNLIFGCSKSDFQKDWLEFIEKKYMEVKK